MPDEINKTMPVLLQPGIVAYKGYVAAVLYGIAKEMIIFVVMHAAVLRADISTDYSFTFAPCLLQMML